MTRVILFLKFGLLGKLFVKCFKLNLYVREILAIAQAVLKNQQPFNASKHEN